jgi:hypothetical protein
MHRRWPRACRRRPALGELTLITAAAAFRWHSSSFRNHRPSRGARRRRRAWRSSAGGQGVNLGFGDVEALAAVLAERGPATDPGAGAARAVCPPSRWAVLAMQTVTDGLVRLFGHAIPGSGRAQHRLTMVDRVPC